MSFLEPLVKGAGGARLAIGVDIRTRDFEAARFVAAVAGLRARAGLSVTLVFLDCDDETLIRRFTETRRRHPLATDRPIADGIKAERRRMAPVRETADHVIDSSQLSINEFRTVLSGLLGLDGTGGGVTVTVTSFAFRHGVPRTADLVFDVRFLANPHYDPDLRPLDGRDPAVAAHVAADPDYPAFFENLTRLLAPLLPRYAAEGKSYLTIAVGCTGGHHRSVFVAESLASWLKAREVPVTVLHRDVDRPDGMP